MRRIGFAAFGLAILAFAASALVFYYSADAHNPSLLTLYGNVDIRQVALSFHDSERIDRILVQEGERVSRGQLLAVQDLDRFQYALDAANAKLEAQRQTVERLEHGSRPQEIGKARHDVKTAEAALRLATQELTRVQALTEKKFAANEEMDKAQANYDQAKGRLAALKEQYSLTAVGPRREDILAAQAQLQADEAAIHLAEKTWKDGYLYAPENAIVQNRLLEPGDMANAQTPVLSLALIDPIWVRTYVSETALGKLRYGMPAGITSDSFPGMTYKGWVGFISPVAEFTPKSVETVDLRSSLVYQVRVYVCNSEDQLRLGMPVTVSIDTSLTPLSQPVCRTAP